MKTNTKAKPVPVYTHEGAKAVRLSAVEELRRSVMACFLWEGTFYESGEDIANRITRLTQEVPVDAAIEIATDARTKGNLRHVPLWMLTAMIQSKYPNSEDRLKVGKAIPEIVQRADEMGELIGMYWKDGKKPLTKQMKIGLANAFKKFNEYQLAKYDSDARALKIRDVMFLAHPKPDNEEQVALFKKVANKELKTPDTWETQLSGGADKNETFTRLMEENKLGVLAFLRNLRNMEQAGVSKTLATEYSKRVKTDRALPFRFISAARAVPAWSDMIQDMMLRALSEHEKLVGKTAIIVDNSGSMHGTKISTKSDLDRADAACALAVIIRELCEESLVIGYGTSAAVVPSHYRGLSLIEQIRRGPGGGTDTYGAIQLAKAQGYDRIIVITDEQSSTAVEKPSVARHKAYFINVATYQNGVGYRTWTHIDGFSESTVTFIRENERLASVVH
jgi:60 kDa SS-A/Ro ribonucleoprotein